MLKPVLPLYQIVLITLCPAHLLSPATSADGCTLQGDAPDLKLLRLRRTPLYINTLKEALCANFWSAHCLEHRRGSFSLAHHPSLHSIFESPSSEDESEGEGEDEDFASRCHSSNIEHACKEAISQVQVYLEIRLVTYYKRSPSEHSDEDSSSGGDGDECYSSNDFDEAGRRVASGE